MKMGIEKIKGLLFLSLKFRIFFDLIIRKSAKLFIHENVVLNGFGTL